jgi:hypothetical protein
VSLGGRGPEARSTIIVCFDHRDDGESLIFGIEDCAEVLDGANSGRFFPSGYATEGT